MSQLVSYAREELGRIGQIYDGMVNEAALELVQKFSKQGHSGGSAVLTLEIASKLMRFQPLTPLTGEDNEWNEISMGDGDNPLYQNRRCSTVFKDNDGAYDIEHADYGQGRRTPIRFPYTPGEKSCSRVASTFITSIKLLIPAFVGYIIGALATRAAMGR